MSEKKSVRMSLSSKKNHILLFESTFDEEGLKTGQRRGAIEISHPTLTPEQIFANAMKYVWAIDDSEEPSDGWYEIKKVAVAETGEELQSASDVIHS